MGPSSRADEPIGPAGEARNLGLPVQVPPAKRQRCSAQGSDALLDLRRHPGLLLTAEIPHLMATQQR